MEIPGAEIIKTLSYRKVNQLGFVVEDMQSALKNFREKLGIRNWYRPLLSGKSEGSILYRGSAIEPKWDFAVGYLGALQFELVAASEGKDIYTEHLEKCGEGLHHICFFVSDMKSKLAAYKAMGIEPVQSGTIISKGGAITNYAYLDGMQINGLIIEIIETRLFGIPIKMSPLMMKIAHMKGDMEKISF